MLIDLTNNEPVIEPRFLVAGGPTTLSTVAVVNENDEVKWMPEYEADAKDIPVVAAAKSRTSVKGGSTISEFTVNERDLYELGTYTIKSWTRRGQARIYILGITESNDPDLECVVTVKAGSTPSVWVCGDEVFVFKKDDVEIPVRYTE